MKELVIAACFVLWNFTVCLLFVADKRRARLGAWRISEKALLICTFLCGAPGALLGMLAVRHKTRHMKFRILVPLALVLQLMVFILIVLLMSGFLSDWIPG